MNNLISEKVILIICTVFTALFILILKFKKFKKNNAKAFFFIYLDLILCILIIYFLQNTFLIEHLIMITSIIFLLICFIIFKLLKLYNNKIGVYFVMFTILIIQLGYIAYTPFFQRQHDSRSFVEYQYGGHFGYMGYIFFNKHLPNGSPQQYWCFYNPPLFYILSVIIIKFQNLCGIELENCLENLQMFSVIYTMIFNIYIYKILKEMNIKKSIIYIMSFVGLAPAMIIMSGSLNNDILSIMLSTMAIFYTIKWYKEDSLKNLIKIAITISLAMMTKISSALIAVSIAVVFLKKVISNINNLKSYIRNFAIFAIIALPIGMWFPVKNLILYDIPFTYVQSVDEDNEANISKYSIFDRVLNIFQKENLISKNIIMTGDYQDNNILITTTKSFIVDENINYKDNFILKTAINFEFYCTIIIIILFLINLIYVLVENKKINNYWILYFLLVLVLELFSYIKFCFDYPFVFTMNFRYIVPILISFSVITGIACENNKKLQYINNIFLSIFSILSIIIFTNLV